MSARVFRLYFIQSSLGPVKIGISDRVERRLRELQTGRFDPLCLLGSIEGSYFVEQQWHKRFAAYRMKGEWFRESFDLMDAIAKAIGEPPPWAKVDAEIERRITLMVLTPPANGDFKSHPEWGAMWELASSWRVGKPPFSVPGSSVVSAEVAAAEFPLPSPALAIGGAG